MTDEKMISRIKALLSQAESTNYEAEADAFIAKAQELMMRHAIDEAMLAAHEGHKQREEIVQREVRVRRFQKTVQGSFLTSLAAIFNCRVYYTNIDTKLPYYIVGFESDAVFVELMFESIRAQSQRAALHEGMSGRQVVPCDDCDGAGEIPGYIDGLALKCETCKGKGKRQRSLDTAARSFHEGYFSRVTMRCRERYKKMEEEVGTSTALALRDKKVQVDEWLTSNISLGKGRASRTRKWDSAAFNAGRKAGENADISAGRGHLKGNRKELK